MAELVTKALSAETWADFATLVEANNGVWGGCWCMWYHGKEGTDVSLEEKCKARNS